MSDSKKSPNLDEVAENLLEQAEIFTEAANPIVDFHEEVDEKARRMKEDAKILTQADNAILNAMKPEPEFVPPKDQQLLFAEIQALVNTQNALDQGSLEADHHYRHLLKDDNPGQYNPESVIDEKIKEEQKEAEEQDLRNEIVDAF